MKDDAEQSSLEMTHFSPQIPCYFDTFNGANADIVNSATTKCNPRFH